MNKCDRHGWWAKTRTGCPYCEVDPSESSDSPAGYDACRLEDVANWLEREADNWDQSADDWAPGSDEALSDRLNATRCRLAAEIVRKAS